MRDSTPKAGLSDTPPSVAAEIAAALGSEDTVPADRILDGLRRAYRAGWSCRHNGDETSNDEDQAIESIANVYDLASGGDRPDWAKPLDDDERAVCPECSRLLDVIGGRLPEHRAMGVYTGDDMCVGSGNAATGGTRGPLEEYVISLLTPVEESREPANLINAIARLARELDKRAGPILGAPTATDPGVTNMPAYGGDCIPADDELQGKAVGDWVTLPDGRVAEVVASSPGDDPGSVRVDLFKPAYGGEVIRAGQAAFEVLSLTDHDKANLLRGTAADPFYDDRKLPKFWEALGCAPTGPTIKTDPEATWRPLVEGDVIREEDKIREPGGEAETVSSVSITHGGTVMLEIAGNETPAPESSIIRRGWEILRP